MNTELLYHLVGYIHKGMGTNLDDLLIESIRNYGFDKQDCLDLLMKFDKDYGGYSKMIERIEKVVE